MQTIEEIRFWEKLKEELIGLLPESVHPWLYSLEFSGYDKGVLTAVTGQAMAKEWLRKNHYQQLESALKRVSGEENVSFNIIYDENAAKKLKKESEKQHKKEIEQQFKEKAMENLSVMQSASNLNLKYKFENFVVGDNNKFAHSAAMAVAKNPAKKYNPLFIYGNSGLGKTHLMQAIGHYTIFNNPKLKVKYTKTDDYINDFISNSRKTNDSIENMSKFYKKYTNIDIILIDDIQFIEGKKKSMDRMQHTFDTLYNKGKQIVITSDRLPKDIPMLTSALCSRFEMGLMVELTAPDYETRYAIIKKLAESIDIKYNNAALEYIAESFTANIRELEGAFTKACAYAELSGECLTKDLAVKILGISNNEVSLDNITKVCAEFYSVSQNDILSSARGQKITLARHIAIYLCRELTGKNLVEIAEYFKKRHTTIMFGYEKIKKEIPADSKLSSSIREIKQALKVI